jgi:Raf kinase inhibitor-like YbhB/YbcL family protein
VSGVSGIGGTSDVWQVGRDMFRGFLTASCVAAALAGSAVADDAKPVTLTVTSAAFAEGQPIPAKYTCDGRDVSPALQWHGAPAGAKSFALICEDPDAPGGTWVHWVIFNIGAGTTSLPENVRKEQTVKAGGQQGLNDFGKTGYNGPCPPAGGAHRYFFRVYALDANLTLAAQVKKADLTKEMEGHIVAEGSLMGTYERR